MNKYRIRNIDCAACAAKIEKGLLKVPGVKQAVLDFATQTLHLAADDIQKVMDEIHRIEPEADIIPSDSDTTDTDHHKQTHSQGFNPKREGAILSVASLMFVLMLIFERQIHKIYSPYFEYAIVLIAYLLAGWNVLVGAVKTVRKKDFLTRRGYFEKEHNENEPGLLQV